MPRVRSRHLLPVYLAHATTHIYIGLFPAVLFMLRAEYSASYGTLGAVFTAAMLAYGLLSLPTGLLLNRVSPLLVVRLVLVGGAVASLAVSLAPNELAFSLALLALGMACGPYHAAGLTLVSRVSGNDAKRLGHHGMVGSIGERGALGIDVHGLLTCFPSLSTLVCLRTWRALRGVKLHPRPPEFWG